MNPGGHCTLVFLSQIAYRKWVKRIYIIHHMFGWWGRDSRITVEEWVHNKIGACRIAGCPRVWKPPRAKASRHGGPRTTPLMTRRPGMFLVHVAIQIDVPPNMFSSGMYKTNEINFNASLNPLSSITKLQDF